jgi:hypothetical protein
MENEIQKQATENKQPINYEEKIEQQTLVVKKLEDSYKKNPSAELELDLTRETDLLRHYENAAVGIPKERARIAVEIARSITINKAVQQVKQ